MKELQKIVDDAELYGMDALVTGDMAQVTYTHSTGSVFVCQATNHSDYVEWREWVLTF